MADELRSINGLTAQVGRQGGLRPPARIDQEMGEGGHSADYHPNEWREPDQPATTRIRRRRKGDISADDIPSPLQQELDRMRSVGEAQTVDTKSLRGRRYYQSDSTNVFHSEGAAPEALPSTVNEADPHPPADPLDPETP